MAQFSSEKDNILHCPLTIFWLVRVIFEAFGICMGIKPSE